MIYISENAHKEVTDYLRSLGHEITVLSPSPRVGELVNTHPDVFMCKMCDGSVIHADKNKLSPVYPGDIPYNAVCTENYFIGNLKHTAPELIKKAESLGLTLVNVRQGYTKCSCVVLPKNAVITADEGVYSVLSKLSSFHVLKVSTGYVYLNGRKDGVIGGTCGIVGSELIVNGDLDAHPDSGDIRAFCSLHSVAVRDFKGLPLCDIGSIIEV